jgi:hypothetical protein
VAVAVAKYWIVVGATWERNENGTVVDYKPDVTTTTTIATQLYADDSAASNYFGSSVAISEYGKSIVVGALYNNNNRNTRRLLTHGTTGAAYLFRYDAPPEKNSSFAITLGPTHF